MEKNISGKWVVFAYGLADHATPGLPITGDAANITANIRIDGGAANAVDDTNPTELEDGYYIFDITAAESNGDLLLLAPESATANVQVIAVPGALWTRPPNFNVLGVESGGALTTLNGHTAQTGDSFAIVDDAVFGNEPIKDALGNLSSGVASGGAVNATSAVITTGTETLTYEATHEQDGIFHEVAPDGGNTDFYYEVTLGGPQSVNSVTWRGYVQSNGDSVEAQFQKWSDMSWKTELIVPGSNGTTVFDETIPAISDYTGTGANLGKVRIRGLSTSATKVATERLRFNYTSNFQSGGYEGGQVWINTVDGEAGTELYRNGTVDRQSLLLADSIVIAAGIPLNKFSAAIGSTITFAESHINEVWSGEGWILELEAQDASGTHINHCEDISGIATSPSGTMHILNSGIGAATLGECDITNCWFKSTFDAGAAGDYNIDDSKSGVSGAGSPSLTFSGLGAPTSVNVQSWDGGGTWVFDSDCTVTLGISIGGTHTITTGGGDIEVRGAPKKIVLNTSGLGTTNISVWSGCPIEITGTGGTVKITGFHGGVTDTSSGTSVTDDGADVRDLPSILANGVTLTPAGQLEVIDEYLDRDMSAGTDSGSPTRRTPRQAMRAIRNKVGVSGGTLTVMKEDDTTASWTAAVTTSPSDPISEIDPA